MKAIGSCFWLLLLPLGTLFPQFSSAFSTHDDDEASKVQSMIAADIEAVLGRTFDYIIVGGGASGCPLAATLSQRYSVLLVERGGLPYGNPLIEDRENYGLALLRSTSIAQEFFSEEGVSNSRGRVLGGTTAYNGGFYSRASAEQVKQAGWDVDQVREAYEWVESKIVFPSPLTAWQYASAGGMLEGGIRPLNDFSLEHIQGTKVGAGIFDVHRRRHTSADLLAAGNTNNLTILLNATVQNIIFHDSGGGKPLRARGIRFIKSDGNPNKFYELHLAEYPNVSGSSCGEVILSAGALGSPQILMLSGIGPKEHLTQFNITPLVDAGGVGQSMQDNPSIAITLDYSSHAQHRMHPDPPQVAGISNDFRLIFETAVVFNTSILPLVAGKMAFPLSRGSLRLVSADPRQNPSVKFNYLAAEKDLDECVEMVRQIVKIAESKSISAFVGRSRQSRLPKDEKEMRNLCKKKVSTAYHYHGGCLVGSVVDKDYKVLGVRGLRVVDFSTFLDTPGTNPMATVLMLGRYQAVKMLREREMSENTRDEGVDHQSQNLVTEY